MGDKGHIISIEVGVSTTCAVQQRTADGHSADTSVGCPEVGRRTAAANCGEKDGTERTISVQRPHKGRGGLVVAYSGCVACYRRYGPEEPDHNQRRTCPQSATFAAIDPLQWPQRLFSAYFGGSRDSNEAEGNAPQCLSAEERAPKGCPHHFLL